MAFVVPLLGAAIAGGGTAAAGGSLLTALSVAGAALTGVSAIQQGQYQAAVAKYNAKQSEQDAAKTMEATQEESKRSDIQYAALLSQQIAEQGASGLDVGSRSFGQARMLTERVRGQQGQDIYNQGTSATGRLLADAANYRAQASQAKTQGYLTAAGAALDAAGSIVKPSLISKTKRYPWDNRKVYN